MTTKKDILHNFLHNFQAPFFNGPSQVGPAPDAWYKRKARSGSSSRIKGWLGEVAFQIPPKTLTWQLAIWMFLFKKDSWI